MLKKILLCSALLLLGMGIGSVYAQQPGAESLDVSWPNGFKSEYCNLFPSPDFAQSWWVCSNSSMDKNHTIWGFASLNKDQSKPVGFLVSEDQLQKLANLPKDASFMVRALNAQGNFLITYASGEKNGVALLQFNGNSPKILSNQEIKSIDNKLWINSALATANKEFTLLWENSGDLSDDGKYTDQAVVQHVGADGHLAWSYQDNSISAFQGRTLSGDVLDHLSDYTDLNWLNWQKRLLVTSNGSIVVWGDAYMEDESDTDYYSFNYNFGEFRTCLSPAGKLVQEIREKPHLGTPDPLQSEYTQLVALKNGNWLKIQSWIYQDNKNYNKDELDLVQYDDHCAQISAQTMLLPMDGDSYKGIAVWHIKSALLLPNDQLLIAYVRGENTDGYWGEDPDSLYVTILDWKTDAKLTQVWNQAVISRNTPESKWLISYDITGRNRDFSSVDLALTPDQKSVFVSVSNSILPEEGDGGYNYLNRLYKVTLPANLK